MTSLIELAELLASPHRALVVEDNPDMSEALAAQLHEHSIDAHIAPTVGEAIALIRNPDLDFNVAFVDLVMSADDSAQGCTSGLDVIQEIRKTRAAVPVIAMTGYLDSQLIDDVHKWGAVVFMRKPQDFADTSFLATLDMLKVRRRPRKANPTRTAPPLLCLRTAAAL